VSNRWEAACAEKTPAKGEKRGGEKKRARTPFPKDKKKGLEKRKRIKAEGAPRQRGGWGKGRKTRGDAAAQMKSPKKQGWKPKNQEKGGNALEHRYTREKELTSSTRGGGGGGESERGKREGR